MLKNPVTQKVFYMYNPLKLDYILIYQNSYITMIQYISLQQIRKRKYLKFLKSNDLLDYELNLNLNYLFIINSKK